MKKVILYSIFFILQYAVLSGAAVLEYLAPKKMGVARFLLYRKEIYGEAFFTDGLVKTYTIFLIAGCIICFVLFIVKLKKGKKHFSLLMSALYNLIGLALLSAEELSAYPFHILGIFIAIVLQYLFAAVIRKSNKPL
ncbi:hypothetical protein [Bacillus benzoevorans]|uniref:Uncharacterized protein n=1 Tax=Bacillus benzoevorans TaxID=1456 RepID=A0A7X0HUM9_9BACI|nr:hypothetical protein [Bacillus benzoevorans]MBB6447143.1 hypothetical protein [Bacillus benzoevorans]